MSSRDTCALAQSISVRRTLVTGMAPSSKAPSSARRSDRQRPLRPAHFTQRGLRRTFNDLARAARVDALVTRSAAKETATGGAPSGAAGRSITPETEKPAERRAQPASFQALAEREKGFEPSTSTLARWHSTTELLPQPSLTRTCGWWPLERHSLASGFGFIARAGVRGQRGFFTPRFDGPPLVAAAREAPRPPTPSITPPCGTPACPCPRRARTRGAGGA
jgi:hypothetical protein